MMEQPSITTPIESLPDQDKPLSEAEERIYQAILPRLEKLAIRRLLEEKKTDPAEEEKNNQDIIYQTIIGKGRPREEKLSSQNDK